MPRSRNKKKNKKKIWATQQSRLSPTSKKNLSLRHKTKFGKFYVGDCQKLLQGQLGKSLQGKVQLILTSPPFPLNRKKSYGNLTGDAFKKWMIGLAPVFAKVLKPSGSIVIELGNSWLKGRPVQSLLHLECLLGFVQAPGAGLRLCQQFICFNPARLPSPAAWVTVKRARTTDSFTHVWWMAKTDFPKADNRRVLRPYGADMRALLARGRYNAGRRPSGHTISKKGFLRNLGGSIAHNVFEIDPIDGKNPPRLPNAFRIGNTDSNDFFLRTCRDRGLDPHPARMPLGLASFFVRFLTGPGDLVLDPFAGSNTTGFAAEFWKRRWLGIELQKSYVSQAKVRFKDPMLKKGSRTKKSGTVRRSS